jgi:adenosylmethionine-8-amino-7-oxononanoate aminotransferase
MVDFWHPFAAMGSVADRGETAIVRGEGAYVFDDRGTRLFDASGALWYANVGHGRRELADAAAAQMRKIAAFSNYGDLVSEPTAELAKRVANVAPSRGSKVFFTSGGGESVETAVKLAFRYWQELGRSQKQILVSRTNAYHGGNGIGTALGGIASIRAGYEWLMPDWAVVQWDDADALERTITELGAEKVAAFICEPVVGAGGVLVAPDGYLETVAEICRNNGVLFIADEVITAFGRLGEWFASSRFGLEPDLITSAKGITSGYVPLGAVVASPRIAEPFFHEDSPMWRHGYTYSGHATATAVALANLTILEDEGLITRGRDLEGPLAAALEPLRYMPDVDVVRAGTGLMAAVVLSAERCAHDPAWSGQVIGQMRERGVIARLLADSSIQISPPLVATEEDFELLAGAIAGAIEAATPAVTAS